MKNQISPLKTSHCKIQPKENRSFHENTILANSTVISRDQELPKDRIYKILKRVAQLQISQSRLTEQVRKLDEENMRLKEQSVSKESPSNDISLLQQRLSNIQNLLSSIFNKFNQSAEPAWLVQFLSSLGQQRSSWKQKSSILQNKSDEIKTSLSQQMMEKDLKIALLQKKLTEQQQFIRWLQKQGKQQKQKATAKEDPIKRINSLYNQFFSFQVSN